MDLLTENPLALMPGPSFLLFYGFVAVALGLGFLVVAEGWDDSGRRESGIPARPNPYEFAYLREGVAGVVWLAIYGLKRAGLVELTDKGLLKPLGDGRPTDRIEAAALAAIGRGCAPSALIADRASGGSFLSEIRAIERALAARGLTRTPDMRMRVAKAAIWLAGGLTALAFYKASVALGHGHHNVAGLFIEWLVACGGVALVAVKYARRGANVAGRAYLSRVQLAHDSRAPSEAAGALTMTLVGLYGFSALAGGPDAAFAQQVKRQQSSDGGGGGSCGSGGGCGGGGCGGCGS